MTERVGFLAVMAAVSGLAGACGTAGSTADLDERGQPIVACEDLDEATCVATPGCAPVYGEARCPCSEENDCSPCPDPYLGCQTVTDGEECVQVIAYAIDPASGECREFPTPCDVPEGWEPCTP
jgi:hypothetical protein